VWECGALNGGLVDKVYLIPRKDTCKLGYVWITVVTSNSWLYLRVYFRSEGERKKGEISGSVVTEGKVVKIVFRDQGENSF
jgi:hypothetical protein